ncbi:protein broad-minded-like isoform X2 [Homarus americanus]|uniref:protein broad-minded-like isoform X2 n=1 Tax=Homarus americanus TaxID=6706 RepID=UPI001C47005B|nr:protein broad-minded-like isoform X2 [Homarus americanus]
MEKKIKIDDATMGSKPQVKDLLTHMDPMIYLAGTADNTSEMLSYLADMDPAFHKLQLVRSLRKGMREDLSKAIEGHVEAYLKEQKGKMRSENPVDTLVEKVVSEDKFTDFVDDTRKSIEMSVQDITNHFDDEIVTGMFANDEDELTFSVSPNDSNESSLNSSLNQSGLLFLHPAQYYNIAKSLQSRKEMETWNDSLNILLAVTPGEPVMQECWPDVKKGLRECLFEDSPEIFDKSLKVHCKLLTSQVHNAVKEAYINLLDALAGFYMSKRFLTKIPLRGENINLRSCENIIRIIKVLTDFQKEFPLLWIRYPERFVDDMVEATFTILGLNLSTKDSRQMTILDMYAVVDPQASWIRRWVHGQWGRSKTFSAMRSNSMVLLHSVSFCIKHLESLTEISHADIGDVMLSSSLVAHLRFSHAINLIMAVLEFSDGRKLFPVNVPSKEELVTMQSIIQIFIRAVNSNVSDIINIEISSLLQKFCSKDEMKSWILCDAGVVELLLQEVSSIGKLQEKTKELKGELELKIPSSYIQAVLVILDTILSTNIGQKYILLGRKRKSSSRSGLSAVTSSPAYEVMNIVYLLLRSKQASSDLKRLTISVCCSLLASPIGIHMCVEHPLIESVIEHLKDKNKSVTMQKIPQGDAPRTSEPLHLSVPQSLPLLATLLLSYKGVFLLESEGVLPLAIMQVLPEMARKGDLNARILASICSSPQGCLVVGSLKVIQPFWDILCHVVNGEDLVQQPLSEEEREEAIEAALAPLMSLTATYQGTQLVFSEQGLLKPISEPLYCTSELMTEMHTTALRLLGSATSVLDSVAFLQASFGYQEQLLTQQHHMRFGEGDSVIVDENSILRNHILVKSYLVGGNGERWLPPLVVEDVSASIMPPLFSQYPPPREYKPEKPIRSMHKKQNEVWRFLTDTRHGLHDIGWLNHCRKAVRAVLSSGEDIKSWLVMDIVDRAVRALSSSTEELLPGSSMSHPTTSAASTPTSPPAASSTTTFNLVPGSTLSPTSSPLDHNEEGSESQSLSEPQQAAVDLVLRYGSQLQVLSVSGSLRENLIDVLKYVQSRILLSSGEKCDWFTMIMFLIYGGNVERCRCALANLSGLLVGAVLWPSLSDSLTTSYEIMPGEMTLGGIIHNVQLVLNLEIPTLHLALQASGDTCLWSIIGEWVRCIFLGVLPWVEVCHYLVLVLLQGPDYAVYFLVALLRHVKNIFNKHAGSHKSLILLQKLDGDLTDIPQILLRIISITVHN